MKGDIHEIPTKREKTVLEDTLDFVMKRNLNMFKTRQPRFNMNRDSGSPSIDSNPRSSDTQNNNANYTTPSSFKNGSTSHRFVP